MPHLDKTWLIGGGLPAPWSYADLLTWAAGQDSAFDSRFESVADVLAGLTRALLRGATIALGDSSFCGEGISALQPSRSGPAAIAAAECELSVSLLRKRKGAVVLQTSGTNGAPRAVRQSIHCLTRAVVTGAQHRGDVWGLTFNPTHIAGVQVYLQALANRNTIVNLWGVGRQEIFARCERWSLTHLSATPTFFRLLLPLDRPLPSVRSITLGGEPADAQLVARIRQAFPSARVHNIYASTEAGTLLISDGVEFSIPPELAGAIQIHESRIWVNRRWLGRMDGEGEKLKAESGNPNAESGGKPRAETGKRKAEMRPGGVESESQLSAFGVSAFPDAWFDTGDLVEITHDAPSRFRIVGRSHDCINVGGEKVNPHEVEQALLEHPCVRQARVYGRRNSVVGQVVSAEIVIGEAVRRSGGETVKQSDGEAVNGEALGGAGAGTVDSEAVKRSGGEEVFGHASPVQHHGFTATPFHCFTDAGAAEVERELREWLRGRLQAYKVPRLIRVVDQLGLTRSGKVARR